MRQTDVRSVLFAVLLAAAVLAGIGVAAQPGTAIGDGAATNETIVVDTGGDGDYQSIQAAVEGADPGDVIEVRSGTYEERVTIDKNVRLVGSGDVTMDGSSLEAGSYGIVIPPNSVAAPVIEGITLTGYRAGIRANATDGDWVVRNVRTTENEVDGLDAENSTGEWRLENATVANNGDDGISADRSTGALTIEDTTIRANGDEGIDIENTVGDWTIRNATIRSNAADGIDADGQNATASWTVTNSSIVENSEAGFDLTSTRGDWTIERTEISGQDIAVVAASSSGDWTIDRAVVRNQTTAGLFAPRSSGDWQVNSSYFQYNRVLGLNAVNASGDWTVTHTTVRDSKAGVYAARTSGAWTIENSSLGHFSTAPFEMSRDGTAIYAGESTGAWTVRSTEFGPSDSHTVTANDSETTGDATRNWWGNGTESDCVGNVDCGDPLSEPPVVDSPSPEQANLQEVTDLHRTALDDFGTRSVLIFVALLVVVSVLAVAVWRMN